MASINKKPENFEQFLALVAQAREALALQATPESTRLAVDIVIKAIDSKFLNSDDAGTAMITPSDTGNAPNAWLAAGKGQVTHDYNDPGLRAVDPALAQKTAVPYDEATQTDKDAKDSKHKAHEQKKRGQKDE